MNRFRRPARNGLAWVTVLLCLAPAVAAAEDPPLDLAAYEGKVVLLDFWASWCGPCGQSFPWMSTMQARHGDAGLVVVAVNLDADRASAEAFLEGRSADFEHVFDPEGRIAEAYGVETMPTSIVLDRQGRPVFRHAGFRLAEKDEYERHLVAALAGSTGDARVTIAKTDRKGVRPWERGYLARPGMAFGDDALDLAWDDHIYFSKEASSGGRGFGGGGCGCN